VKLEREDGRRREVASRADIEQYVADLGARKQELAVLSAADGSFAQATGSASHGFVLEVRDPNGGTHHQSRRSDLSHREILDLFVAFLGGARDRPGGIEYVPGPMDGERIAPPLAAARTVKIAVVLAVFALGGAECERRTAQAVLDNLGQGAAEVEMVSRSSSKSMQHDVTARYTVDGASYVVRGKLLRKPHVGERVPVFFDRRDPASTARLGPTRTVWQGAIMLATVGALLLAIAAVSWWISRRRAADPSLARGAARVRRRGEAQRR